MNKKEKEEMHELIFFMRLKQTLKTNVKFETIGSLVCLLDTDTGKSLVMNRSEDKSYRYYSCEGFYNLDSLKSISEKKFKSILYDF